MARPAAAVAVAAALPARAVRGSRLASELCFCAALGALQTLAYVHTAWWPLQLACIGGLAWRAAARPPPVAAALGLAYGSAWLVAGTWWIYISLHRYGGLPAWMAVLAVLALSMLLSLYLALAMAAFARWRSGRVVTDALLFAACWLLAELARGVIFTGFPWLASGYAQVDAPLAALAPWVGVYGIGFAAALLAAVAALGAASARRRWLGPAVAAAVVGALAIAGTARFTQPSGTLAVTLLQGNIPQEEKFEKRFQGEALAWHIEALTAARGDLVVAPETAVPLLPAQLPQGFWDALRQRFADGRTHALFGMPLGDRASGHTNSAVGLGPGGPPGGSPGGSPGMGFYRYDKHHLVPFGEFIPFGFKWFTRMMNIPLGDFNRGPLDATAFAVAGQRVAPNICYEDLFGEELAARFADAAEAPTIFANLSNIGWFGDTVAIPQHLNISRLRTLEFQRPMLRATNTGATAVVDHRGRVAAALAPYTRGALEARVEGRTGLTPFARWAARLGLWPPAALAAAVVAAAALASRRRTRPAQP